MVGIINKLYQTGTFKFTHYKTTVFYRYSEGATAQKRLRITDLSFQYGKGILRFETRRDTVVVVSVVYSKQQQINLKLRSSTNVLYTVLLALVLPTVTHTKCSLLHLHCNFSQCGGRG